MIRIGLSWAFGFGVENGTGTMRGVLPGETSLSYSHGSCTAPQVWRSDDLCDSCLRIPWRPDDPLFLNDVLRRIDDGPGFVVLTGIRVAETSLEGAERLTLEVVRGFGEPLPQGDSPGLTCLVRDEGHVIRPEHESGRLLARGAKSSKSRERLELHNDNAPRWLDDTVDLLGMLAVHEAASGGETILASARTVWSTLVDENPDAARVLCEDFAFDRTVTASGARSTSVGPVFSPEGRFAMRCNRVRIETAALYGGTALSEARCEALDALDEVLARRELQHRFTLRAGECLLLDDSTVVHGRTAYQHGTAGSPRRCLVRVWIRRSDRPPVG